MFCTKGWGSISNKGVERCKDKMHSRVDSQAQLIANPSSHKLLPTPVTVSGISFVSTFWIAVTFLCTAGLIIAAGFPYWSGVDTPRNNIGVSEARIGLFYYCYTPSSSSRVASSEECSLYVPPSMPHNDTRLSQVLLNDVAFLFASSVVYGIGTVLLLISLLIGAVAYCKPRVKGQSVFLVGFTIQLFACMFLIVALIIFPLMFNSNFAHQFCGTASTYYMRGRCDVQWCTILAMVTTSISLYLPAFALFSMNISDGLRAYKCC